MLSNVICSNPFRSSPRSPTLSQVRQHMRCNGGHLWAQHPDQCFLYPSRAFASVELSRPDKASLRLTRKMKTTKPSLIPLRSAATASIKVVRLLQLPSDMTTSSNAKGNEWSACAASEAFWFPPQGSPIAGKVDVLSTQCILGEFKVREILSDWPELRLRLSNNANTVMGGYKETHINPASQTPAYPNQSRATHHSNPQLSPSPPPTHTPPSPIALLTCADLTDVFYHPAMVNR